jgi:hypothetical protein
LAHATIGTAISAPKIPATSDREHHRERVHPHGAAQQQRLQHVPLELHDAGDDGQRDQRRDGALRDQGHQHGDRPGEERADDGDERAQEHQRRQGHHQRHLQHGQADADEHRVEQRHDDGRPDVGDQRAPGAAGRLVDEGAGVPGKQADQPEPDGPPVLEEEEQGEQRQDEPGHHLADRGGGRDRAGGEGLLVVHQGVLRLGDRVLELPPRDRERGDHEVLDLPDALADLVGQVGEAVDEALDDQRDDAGDDAEPDDQHGQRGQGRGPSAAHQPTGSRLQQRRQQQRDDDGDDDDRDVGGRPQQQRDPDQDDDQPPGPGRGQPQTVRHAVHVRVPRRRPAGPADLARRPRAGPRGGRRSADAARSHGTVQVGCARFGAAQRGPAAQVGRTRAVVRAGGRRQWLVVGLVGVLAVVEDQVVDVVVVLVVLGDDDGVRPGVRVVLGRRADALPGLVDQAAGTSQHRLPPPGPWGPSMITLALRKTVPVARRADRRRAVPR